jgi:hypothetical protein
MDRRLDYVIMNDERFSHLVYFRARIMTFIVQQIGRAGSLYWEPKEILREYMNMVHNQQVPRLPENKRAKVGGIVWIM